MSKKEARLGNGYDYETAVKTNFRSRTNSSTKMRNYVSTSDEMLPVTLLVKEKLAKLLQISDQWLTGFLSFVKARQSWITQRVVAGVFEK